MQRKPRRFHRLRRLVGAVLLGLGTIFGLKGDTDAHWATPPHWLVSAEAEDGGSQSGDDEF